MKTRFLGPLLCILLLATCATIVSDYRQQQPKLPPPTLFIHNTGITDFVVLLNSQRIGYSAGGSKTCIKLRNLSADGVHYIALRALATEVAIQAPAEHLNHARGWRMTVGQSPSLEVHSLEPAAACGT